MIFLNSPVIRFQKPEKRSGFRGSSVIAGTILAAVVAIVVVPGALTLATGSHGNITDCPIDGKNGRTIVMLPDEVKLMSHEGLTKSETARIGTNLPKGEYTVTLVAADGYDERKTITQPKEQYKLRLLNSSGETVVTTGATSDLPDKVSYVQKTYVVNEKLVVTQDVTKVIAFHAAYPDKTSPNSVIPICAAFDKIEKPVEIPALTGSCTAAPASVRTGEEVEFKATATGGTGTYTYSWTGTDGLSGNAKNVEKTYSSHGEKYAKVTITSGDKTISRECSATVEKPEVPAITGSCTATPSSIRTNEKIEWKAEAAGGTGTYTYSWSGTDGLSGDAKKVEKTYSTHGTKSAKVTITSGDKTITRECSAKVQKPEVPALTGSCTAPASIRIGEMIEFKADAEGGNGSYTYSWSGTDNLSGNAKKVEKTYASHGEKHAKVTITSGDKTIIRECSTKVLKPEVPALGVSCNASVNSAKTGEAIEYAAYVWGGTGSYSYDWSGSEGLSGSSKNVVKAYGSAGDKVATVKVTSGDQSVEKTCSVTVKAPKTPEVPALTGSCYASQTSAKTGDSLIWYATANGGNGTIKYSWTGTDNLSSESQNVAKSYDTAGTKSATVVITSGNQSVTKTCETNISQTEVPAALLAACAVSPTNATVNQRVVWSATASGGNGGHTFTWNGTDNLSGTGALVEKTYDTPGTKVANVVVTSANGQSVAKTCEVMVGAGVPLDEVPYTGFADMLPIALFTTGVVAIGGTTGLFFIRRKQLGENDIWDENRMNM